MCTDQTGKFRVRSVGGFNYVIVTHSCNTNVILVRLLKIRTGTELVETVQYIHNYLALRGHKLKYHIIYNEVLFKMKEYLKS